MKELELGLKRVRAQLNMGEPGFALRRFDYTAPDRRLLALDNKTWAEGEPNARN